MSSLAPSSELPPARELTLAHLVGVLAHDLRNPLTALITNLHFVRGSAGDSIEPDAVEALDDSVVLCKMLERFIRNLELVARHDQNGARRQPVSLSRLVGEHAERARQEAHTNRNEIVVERPAEDAHVLVDRDLFARAVENVVADAVERAPMGVRIVLRIARDGGDATLSVHHEDPAEPAARHAEDCGLEQSGCMPRPLAAGYGRGLGVLCADIAARAAGGRLELTRHGRSGRLRLLAPVRG